jgi:hypothetical protein
MNATDKRDTRWMRCSSKRTIKVLVWATASVCLSFSASYSFAEKLPTEFLGRWMVYSDKSPNNKCNDVEEITVFAKSRFRKS